MMAKIEDIFDVVYGVNLEFNKMTPNPNGVPFVARGASNNGVVGFVEIIDGIVPNPGNTISVAGGGSVLESFYQEQPYYSGRDLYYLRPKQEISSRQMLFYCLTIRSNKWRYSYGRQANKTLKEIKVPAIDEIPHWVDSIEIPNQPTNQPVHKKIVSLQDRTWRLFELSSLFEIERGRGARKENLIETGKTPFITSIDSNNGLSGMVNESSKHNGNVISVNRNGSVGYAFYQAIPFCSTEDVHVFNPRFELNMFVALFLTTIIRAEKFKYSYGRKWGLDRMRMTKIKLPVDNTGNPDWAFMEYYIKSLPYSKNLEQIDTQVRKREKPLALKGDLDDILGLAVSKPKNK